MNRTVLHDVLKVLASCEAKLEYLGREFSRPNFTDRYNDGPDCLHRAYKARDAIEALKRELSKCPKCSAMTAAACTERGCHFLESGSDGVLETRAPVYGECEDCGQTVVTPLKRLSRREPQSLPEGEKR